MAINLLGSVFLRNELLKKIIPGKCLVALANQWECNGGGTSFFSVPKEGNTLKPGAKRTTLKSDSECFPAEPKKRKGEVAVEGEIIEVVHNDKMVEIDKGVAECKLSPMTVETVLEDGREEEDIVEAADNLLNEVTRGI
jgi:hypothetical protein